MIDLAALGADCVSDAAYGMETLDLETLQDAARDGAYSAADNACIYYRDCMEIVSRYESAFGDDVEPTGATFEAHQWQEALAAYACGIAQNVISRDVENALESVKECADSLYEAAEELGYEDGGYVSAIATKVRHKGTGKYLLNAAERVISEKFARIYLFVSESNHAAQRFYKSAGYEEIARAHDCLKAGNTEILLTKTLV